MKNTKLSDLISQCEEGISGLEKSAFINGEVQEDVDLASSIEHLLKQANDETTTGTQEMRKEAREAGVALAYDILKQANMSPALLAEMAAEQDAASLDNPQGTVNQIKAQLIQRAVRPNAMEPDSEAESALEGVTEADAEAAAPIKSAAVRELVEQGMDFATAVALVKQATEEPSPTWGDRARNAWNSTKETAGKGYAYTKDKAGKGYRATADFVKAHPKSVGGGAAGLAAGAVAYGLTRKKKSDPSTEAPAEEKTAAVISLVQEGYSFEDAVNMVKQAEISAYEIPSLEKAAYIDDLVQHGYDFDSAVIIVKQAEQEAMEELMSKEAAGTYRKKKGPPPKRPPVTPHSGPALLGKPSLLNRAKYALRAHPYLAAGAAATALAAGGAAGYYGYNKRQTTPLDGSPPPAEVEKAAAVNELIQSGYSFEDAVNLVKVAEEEVYAELNGATDLHVKMASALEDLIGEGVDYDTAVDLVNSAADGSLDL